ARVAEAFGSELAVVHVPKTIDNDLPLPADVPTFGFTTAVNVGKDLVRNLMADAAATGKWFVVTGMGRHAGHLARRIGAGAGAPGRWEWGGARAHGSPGSAGSSPIRRSRSRSLRTSSRARSSSAWPTDATMGWRSSPKASPRGWTRPRSAPSITTPTAT